MLRRDPSAVFRSVLLLSAVGTACGGAVDSVGGGSGATETTSTSSSTSSSSGGKGGSTSSTSSGGSTSSSGFTSSSGGSTSSSGGSSTSSSGGSSTSSSSGGSTSSSSGGSTSSSSGGTSTSSSGGNWTCKTGSIPLDDTYCCAPGSTCPTNGGDTADAGSCTLDCTKVCGDVAPGVSGGFNWCYVNGDQIQYTCGACGVGRLPNDTKPCPLGETIGERLARQAYYEGVSVVAFERLAAVLEANDAPASLVARARAAAKDEARHATIFGELARAHGATVPALELAAAAPTLFDLAIENATEGCVRETLGAAITMHQAMHAETEEIRAAYAAICDDEAEHAAFSWELKGWLDTQLTAYERGRVERAHRAAVEAARADAIEPLDAPAVALGLPSPERARRMLDLAIEAMAA